MIKFGLEFWFMRLQKSLKRPIFIHNVVCKPEKWVHCLILFGISIACKRIHFAMKKRSERKTKPAHAIYSIHLITSHIRRECLLASARKCRCYCVVYVKSTILCVCIRVYSICGRFVFSRAFDYQIFFFCQIQAQPMTILAMPCSSARPVIHPCALFT